MSQFMVPVLRVISDCQVRERHELYDLVAQETHLGEEQRFEVLDSGERRYENRISWAISYLLKANAASRLSRGHYAITEFGRSLLDAHPDRLTEADLRLIEGYIDRRKRHIPNVHPLPTTDELDPHELVEQGIAHMNSEAAGNLLSRLHTQNVAFFEQAVADLVVAMGYGGADARATRTQLSNDEGIYGIIDQDVLGLNRAYIQAKRYPLDSSVQRPEIQSFVGALQGQQTNQGVFITTGRFTTEAKEYTRSVSTRVVLIDGPRLAELMIRYRVGVQVKRTLQIVDIDEDFFE